MNLFSSATLFPVFLAGTLTFPTIAQDTNASASNEVNAGGNSNSAASAKGLDQETRDLKPRDSLRFSILEDPARANAQFGRVDISELGDAQFPISAAGGEYINVKAAGRRLADVRREVKQRLEEDYYHTATVSVDVLGVAGSLASPSSANFGKVVIYGSISHTIVLPEDRKRTLSDVFSGLPRQDFVNLKKVEVFRWDAKAQKLLPPVTKNVKKMLDSGDLTDDIELSDGDRIKVIDRGVIF